MKTDIGKGLHVSLEGDHLCLTLENGWDVLQKICLTGENIERITEEAKKLRCELGLSWDYPNYLLINHP